MYPNPYILDVSNLDKTQRRAMIECVVGSFPNVTVDQDDLMEFSRWTLRKPDNISVHDFDEEIEYIESIFKEACNNTLVPLEDYCSEEIDLTNEE